MKVVAVALTIVLGLGSMSQDDPTPNVDGGKTDSSFTMRGFKDGLDKTSPGPVGSSASPGSGPGARTPNSSPSVYVTRGACTGAKLAATTPNGLNVCVRESTVPVLTVGDVRRAFAELKLPAGKLVIQPPDGLTLVNFDTNFYTTSTEAISREVTLLGQAVTIEATPDTFTWSFGDGESKSTADPGAAYPDLRVTHNYARKGTYRPTLDTTYTGRFKVGNGLWRQIPGTVTIDGAAQSLRAIEATPKLVGY